ncbi:extracellular solute-binding protein [Pseudaeromonas paramecii]|uniref:Putrescine-binding periplasmic protein n=1 Tax=Pseudaeromonas paramecii TaxID=2138166 RepID=A0ABP8QML5_9GAMM
MSFVKGMFSATLVAAMSIGSAVAQEEKVLHVYNWSDYIAEDTVANFEKATGIKVVYDVFDSNEVLEAKLLAGNTGFDLVVPSSDFLARQIQAGVFMALDKSKLPNLKNMDPVAMKLLADKDPDNAHSIPYLGGTTGIGFNPKKVAEVMGPDFKMDSWDAVFKPENLAKLNKCGVSFLNAPTEIFATALHYMGKDSNSLDPKDYQEAGKLLASLRPYITYFHSSQYINDLANGDICVAIGWSGDVMQAAARAEEANNGVAVDYVIPKEGALMFYDMLAIPADAKHPENALAFINYLMEPEVIAKVSNYVSYASANKASLPLVDEALRTNPNIYPTEEMMPHMFALKVLPAKVNRVITREWTKVKTGK